MLAVVCGKWLTANDISRAKADRGVVVFLIITGICSFRRYKAYSTFFSIVLEEFR
jgi:hypothetical protein